MEEGRGGRREVVALPGWMWLWWREWGEGSGWRSDGGKREGGATAAPPARSNSIPSPRRLPGPAHPFAVTHGCHTWGFAAARAKRADSTSDPTCKSSLSRNPSASGPDKACRSLVRPGSPSGEDVRSETRPHEAAGTPPHHGEEFPQRPPEFQKGRGSWRRNRSRAEEEKNKKK